MTGMPLTPNFPFAVHALPVPWRAEYFWGKGYWGEEGKSSMGRFHVFSLQLQELMTSLILKKLILQEVELRWILRTQFKNWDEFSDFVYVRRTANASLQFSLNTEELWSGIQSGSWTFMFQSFKTPKSAKLPHLPGPPHTKLIVELNLEEVSPPLKSWHASSWWEERHVPTPTLCPALC